MHEHYRNKCEFSLSVRSEGAGKEVEGAGKEVEESAAVAEGTGTTVVEGTKVEKELVEGAGTEGAGVVVGFRLGSYEEGDFEVVSAASCCHIPERTKELLQVHITN